MLYAQLCGGLGNQMFQYACARALSERLGQELCLDFSFYNATPSAEQDPRGLFELFSYNIKYDSLIFSWRELHERYGPKHRQSEALLRFYEGFSKTFGKNSRAAAERLCAPFANFGFGLYACEDRFIKEYPTRSHDAVMTGYRQSERYFKAIASEIKKELRLKTPPSKDDAALYEQIRSSEAVCVHVRRGDYASKELAGLYLVCTPEYYSRGAQLLAQKTEDPVFYVFSDDPDWAKNNIRLEGETVCIKGSRRACEELRLMSACRHFVISNSSFSWWAQYLCEREKGTVVAPSRWYANGRKTDIYQNNWQLLDC
ncbi:MAG: alpha-1,2-fucosyltransferase [Oscillospiraceae bacterium]|nr:alpha-1,2-fucosyltransferase [Oscillospiraceae bacterium]